MTLRSQYAFQGSARWGFGWENPNHAAAVIAICIPMLWALAQIFRRRKRSGFLLGAIFTIEVLVVSGLALTYSRGAMLALIGGLIFYGVVCTRGMKHSRNRELMFIWAPRFALLAIVLMTTGLDRRFRLSVAGDRSVGNRVELWHGGLKLVKASPLIGWGKGNSGNAYMQWIQDPARDVIHHGMVNSYLHISVEHGIPLLWLFCFLILAPIAMVLHNPPNLGTSEFVLTCGCSSALVVFAIAAIFSTLWIVPSVIFAPLLVVAGLMYFLRNSVSRLHPALTHSAYVACIGAIAVYVSAEIVSYRSMWMIRRAKGGGVEISHRVKTTSQAVTILADGRTLGPYFGKEIRRAMMNETEQLGALTVYPPGILPAVRDSGPVVVFGPRFREYLEAWESGMAYAIFPAVDLPPRNGDARFHRVYLPELDEFGFRPQWETWCKENRIPFTLVKGAGQNATNDLPALLRSTLTQRN